MTSNSRSFQAIKCQCASVGQKCYCTRITFVKVGAEVLNELTCLNSLNEQHDLKENVQKWSSSYTCLLFTIPSTNLFSVPRLQDSQKDTLECLTGVCINKHTRGCLYAVVLVFVWGSSYKLRETRRLQVLIICVTQTLVASREVHRSRLHHNTKSSFSESIAFCFGYSFKLLNWLFPF